MKRVLYIALYFFVLSSSILVIYTSYEYRFLLNELNLNIENQNFLQDEYGMLLLEESTLLSPNRVEQIAKDNLNMINVKSSDIIMVFR